MRFKIGDICVLDLWKFYEYCFIRYYASKLSCNKTLKDNPWLMESLYIIKINDHHYILKSEHTPIFMLPIEFVDYCFILKKSGFIDLENELL